MKAADIIRILETKFPVTNAEEWDNVGLIVGNHKKNIKRIQFSLDVTENAIEHAIKHNIDMIISHHPMIFKPIKKINSYSLLGKKLLTLNRENINVYSMHTNLDSSYNGLNDYILTKLEARESKTIALNEDGVGIGRYFVLDKDMTIKAFSDILKTKLDIQQMRYVGTNFEKKIKRVGIINGSAMNYWKLAKSLGIELFITGDISYHDALEAKESGLHLLDFGHYESERFFYELIKEELKDKGLEFYIFNDGPVFNFV